MVELYETQYPDSAGKPARHVYVGLDFGTAFTKVVIADSSDSFAVKLRPDLGGVDAYLQPGLLSEDADGNFLCAASLNDRRSFQNLKLALMHVPDNCIARGNVALFLALVLQQARSRFMADHRGIFGNNELAWHLNIGLPAENCDNAALTTAFRAVAEAAWALSLSKRQLSDTESGIARAVAMSPDVLAHSRFDSIRGQLVHRDNIGVLPEVQAETVCYATSHLRREGLHLLVDVGAGTLDMNLFGLISHGDGDRYVCWCAKVLPLGSAYLAKHRLRELEIRGLLDEQGIATRFTEYAAIPGRRELADRVGLTEDDIEEIDGEFLNQVGAAVWGVIDQVRQQYGNAVHRFHADALPAFLTGGGSTDAAYRGRMRLVHRHRGLYGWAGLDIRPLPCPERLRMPGVGVDAFHRLAVAYGLAHDLLNLGDFIPADGAVAAPPTPVVNWRDNFVDAERSQ